MNSLKAGELNKRITLLRSTTVRDDVGAEKASFEEVARVWAKAEAMSNRKVRTAEQDQVIETYRFTVRPRGGVDIGWLVDYQGRSFTVRAVDRNESDRLIITTEADNRHDRA